MTPKGKLTIITTILLAIGVISGLVILYDYLETPHLISKDQAFAIATRTGNWSQNFLSDKTVDMKLLHVKTKWFAFIVDEKTFEDIIPHCPKNGPCVEPQEIHGVEAGQYVWIITVTGQPPNILSGRQWGYMIDATNGQVLQ